MESKFLPTPSARRATIAQKKVIALPVEFLPTPSARRATSDARFVRGATQISTHALREEGDRSRTLPPWRLLYFYPRPPRGGRPLSRPRSRTPTSTFLPTPSARRATYTLRDMGYDPYDFYPRPPRGGRRQRATRSPSPRYFYPRPPRGGRQTDAVGTAFDKLFLPTPSARRATCNADLHR